METLSRFIDMTVIAVHWLWQSMRRLIPKGGWGKLIGGIEGSAPFRLLRMLEVPAIIVALFAFGLDYFDRDTDRAVQRATMLTTIVQLAGTVKMGIDVRPNPAVPILEALVREKMDFSGLSLTKTSFYGANLAAGKFRGGRFQSSYFGFANLSDADFKAADFSDAILSKTNLNGANLRWARLLRAKLDSASFDGTDLNGAVLSDADISKADLSKAKNLTSSQIAEACIKSKDALPKLPMGFKTPKKICPN